MEVPPHDDVLATGRSGSSEPGDTVQCDRCHRLIARTACLTFEGADYVYHFCGPGCCSIHDAGQGSDLRGESTPEHVPAAWPGVEAGRVRLLMARDGKLAAREWVARTLAIYRRAVVDRRHFASTPTYRRRFILSYLSFRRWLARDVRRRTST